MALPLLVEPLFLHFYDVLKIGTIKPKDRIFWQGLETGLFDRQGVIRI